MKCLGHHFDHDGGIASCFSKTKGSMWRSFYGNLSKSLLASSVPVKMRFLNSSIASIAAFRWARWPFQETYAGNLDGTQRRMISILMDWKPSPQESFDDFARRRRIKAGRMASRRGRWSHLWADSVKKWNAHVLRRHDAHVWSPSLLEWHGEEWLQHRRALAWTGGTESRTNTRAYRGKVQRRWTEGLKEAQPKSAPRTNP